MRRCVIVGGAEIRNYYRLRDCFRPDDFFVYCDCGLRHESGLGRSPDLIIGDFDSHVKPEKPMCEIIVLPCVKDDTDTIFAVKESLRRGFHDFVLVGAVGGRMDHTLGNIYALLMLRDAGAEGVILDDCSEMRIVSAGETVRIAYGCRFFSLMNITGRAEGITIRHAKYELDDAAITPEYQYGISNEVLSPEHDAEVTLREGSLLLIRVI